MARRDDDKPTEMPEKLFRQTDEYREVREIARQAEAARGEERAEAAADRIAAMSGGAATPVVAFAMSLAGSGWTRLALVAAAVAGWISVLVLALKWGGVI